MLGPLCLFAQIDKAGVTSLSLTPRALGDKVASRPAARHIGGINNRHLFWRRKEAGAKDIRISTLFIIWWRMCTAGTVKEKVKMNQSRALHQPTSNCILTRRNRLQTGGLDAC